MDYPSPDPPVLQSLSVLWPAPARPCSSIYSDHFSLEDLGHKVDESLRVIQLGTIERLMRENWALQDVVIIYRQMWYGFMELFDEVMDLALLIQGTLEAVEHKITIAEEEWLASWGIGKGEVMTWI